MICVRLDRTCQLQLDNHSHKPKSKLTWTAVTHASAPTTVLLGGKKQKINISRFGREGDTKEHTGISDLVSLHLPSRS